MFKWIANKFLKLTNDGTVKLLLTKIDSLQEDIIELNEQILMLKSSIARIRNSN